MNSFKEIALAWKVAKQPTVKKSTMAAYNLILNHHLIPYFESFDFLNEVTIKELVELKIKEGLSSRSVKGIISVLKMILRFSDDILKKPTPNLNIRLPKVTIAKEVDVFTRRHQQLLLEHIYSNLTFKNLGILICLNTGLRIGEICALKWKDIDLIKGSLLINKTVYRLYLGKENEKKTEVLITSPKTPHSSRKIPMPDFLINILKPFLTDVDKENFILSNTGKPIEPRCYRNYYKRLLNSLKLPELKFHCLRHSFATRCIEAGGDYKTVSAILGHADISTTLNLYVHPSQEQKKQCIENMLKSVFQ